jgi:hypothetical protein
MPDRFSTLSRSNLAIVLAFFATSAEAGVSPSFDCARAHTRIEELICGQPNLARMDREMGETFSRMFHDLPLGERGETLRIQRAWSRRLTDICTPWEQTSAERLHEEIIECLVRQYDAWSTWANNRRVRVVGPYAIANRSRIEWSGTGYWTAEYEYPWITSPTDRHTAAFNDYLLGELEKHRTFTETDKDFDRDLTRFGYPGSSQVTCTVTAATKRVIALRMYGYAYTGGAHGNGSTSGLLWSVKEHRELDSSDVFARQGWGELAQRMAIAAFTSETGRAPTDADKEAIASTISDFRNWVFHDAGVTIVFNPYALGSYIEPLAGGVQIPYSTLRGYLTRGGPIPPE